MGGAFGTHASPHHALSVANHACSAGGLDAQPGMLFGAFSTLELRQTLSTPVVKRGPLTSNLRQHTATTLANLGPAWSTIRTAKRPRRLRSSAACGLNGRMLALPLSMHALVRIKTA